MKIQRGNTGWINFPSYFAEHCLSLCVFHTPMMHADLPSLVLPLNSEWDKGITFCNAFSCTVMQSANLHLGSFPHRPLWLNPNLLTCKAAFLSELSAQIPDLVAMVVVMGVGGGGVWWKVGSGLPIFCAFKISTEHRLEALASNWLAILNGVGQVWGVGSWQLLSLLPTGKVFSMWRWPVSSHTGFCGPGSP